MKDSILSAIKLLNVIDSLNTQNKTRNTTKDLKNQKDTKSLFKHSTQDLNDKTTILPQEKPQEKPQENTQKNTQKNKLQNKLLEKYKDLNIKFCAQDLANALNYNLETDKLHIANALDSNITKYYKDIESALNTNFLEMEQNALYTQKLQYKHIESNANILQDLLKKISKFDNNFNVKFYTDEIKNTESKERLKELHKNMLNSWEKSLQNRLNALRQKKIDSIKNELLQRIKKWIEAIEKLKELFRKMGSAGDIFSEMSLDSMIEGLASGKDLSEFKELENLASSGNNAGKNSGNLQRKMINFTHFLRLLEQDSIKRLCDMLGKLQKEQKKLEIESYTQSQSYNIKIPCIYASDEIAGVRLGRDLENTLPFDYSLLMDNEFSILFDMKYAENRLLCFQKQGYVDITQTFTTPMQREKEVEDKKGPIILCVDTSGSMSGMPETIAKVVSLYIAKRAIKQKRKCFLINFSTGIKTLDLSGGGGLLSLMDFLELSFNGGTDSIPALKAALKKCESENYKKADILMISDFIFDTHNLSEIKNLMQRKDKENKCHALYIGNFSGRNLGSDKLFDSEFIYNPHNHNVEFFSTESAKNLAKITSKINDIFS